jgi:hypothetical protein
MKMTYMKHFKSTALLWLGCLILFVIVYFLVHKNQKQTIAELDKKLTEQQQLYVRMLAASSEEAQLRLKNEVEDMREKIRPYVTDGEGASTLTFDISRIASEKKVSGFSIKNKEGRNFTDVPQCESIAESSLDVSFSGSFNQFANFMNSLERHSPVVFVDWFTIRQPQNDNITESEVTMGLSVFVAKQKS